MEEVDGCLHLSLECPRSGRWLVGGFSLDTPSPLPLASGAGEGPSCGLTKRLRWRMEADQVRPPHLLCVPGTGSAFGLQSSCLGGGSCLRTRGQRGLRRSSRPALLCKYWAAQKPALRGSPCHVVFVCERPQHLAVEGQGPHGRSALSQGCLRGVPAPAPSVLPWRVPLP